MFLGFSRLVFVVFDQIRVDNVPLVHHPAFVFLIKADILFTLGDFLFLFDEFLDHEAVRYTVVAFVFEFEEFGERIWILDFLVGFAVEILFAFE